MGEKRIRYLTKLSKFKEKISKTLPVDKFILFGSRAKGEHTLYSDFDIIIVSKKFKGLNKLERPFDLYLQWDLKKPVEFLCYTPEEFKRLKNEITIIREAVKEGIEIK